MADNYAIRLAEYGLRNALWREVSLSKRLTLGEALKLSDVISRAMSLMKVLCPPDWRTGAIKTAVGPSITAYDAAYLYTAKALGAALVSEDAELLTKAAEDGVEALSLNQLRRRR